MARLSALTPGRPTNVAPAARPVSPTPTPIVPGPNWQIIAALVAQGRLGSTGLPRVLTDNTQFSTDSTALTTDVTTRFEPPYVRGLTTDDNPPLTDSTAYKTDTV